MPRQNDWMRDDLQMDLDTLLDLALSDEVFSAYRETLAGVEKDAYHGEKKLTESQVMANIKEYADGRGGFYDLMLDQINNANDEQVAGYYEIRRKVLES